MKRILFIFLLVISALVVHAQQSILKADPNDKIKLDPYKPTDTSAVDQSKVYAVVQSEPDFVGGREKFNQYIKQNIHYPENAKNVNIQGRVFLGFVVERDGSITDIKVIRGLSTECDAEAIRLISNSPKWNPGLQNGHTVRVHYVIPVEFRL
jgi:protein TonB